MDMYFAGAGASEAWMNAIIKSKGQKSLHSYPDLKKNSRIEKHMKTAIESQKKIFIDSGGYSAHTQGVEIDIAEYSEWLNKYKSEVEVYAVLDVIGDFKATMKNQRYMEQRGLTPIPVFHYGEDFGALKELVSNYDYIALGGMVPYARQKHKLYKFLDKCYSIIRTDAKVHGFGATGIETMKRYPFYSADSISWLGGSMRAEIYYFENGKLKIVSTKEKEAATYKSISLSDNEGNKYWMDRVIFNAIEWQKFEKYVTELWSKRGVKWN